MDRTLRKASGRTHVTVHFHSHRTAYAALLVSTVVHLMVWLIPMLPQLDAPPVEPRRVERFAKRLPLPRRPLARRQIQESVRRALARSASVRSSPVLAVGPAPLARQQLTGPGIPVPLVSAPSPPPAVPVQPLLNVAPAAIGAAFRPGSVRGTRTATDQVDLGMELLDTEAMDTGRHRALVVVDPGQRRALRGFLYMSGVYSEGLEQAERDSPTPRRSRTTGSDGELSRQEAEQGTLQGLADRMRAQTGVRTEVRRAIRLDDRALLAAPFVLLTVNSTFEHTPAEAANLGRYLTSGGFLYAEVVRPPVEESGGQQFDIPALRALIRAALAASGCQEGREWSFERLPSEHPLYHCYYDIDSLPMGYWDGTYIFSSSSTSSTSPDYLEGIRLGAAWVGVYSLRNYSDFWAGEEERAREAGLAANQSLLTPPGRALRVYDLGVNVLVYALTREGSLAQRFVAAD